VESLEDRLLLSGGLDGAETSGDQAFLEAEASSLSRQKTVYLKVADLVADGLGPVIKGLDVQDGQVQANRIDKLILLAGQYFEYASGRGYPLVPASGPVLSGDVGVPHGPLPVLLPTREPATFVAPTPPVPGLSPVVVASSSSTFATPVTRADIRSDGNAALAPSTPTTIPTAPAALPSTPQTSTSTAASATSAAPAQTPPPAGEIGTLSADPATSKDAPALNVAAVASAATNAPDPSPMTLETPASAPSTSTALIVPPGMSVVAATPSTPASPAQGTALGGRPTLPNGNGLEPPPDSIPAGEYRVPDPRQPAEDGNPVAPAPPDVLDGPAFVPVPSVDDPSTMPENLPALPFEEGLPEEVEGMVYHLTSELGGRAADEDVEAAEDADSTYGVAPFVITSATCVLLGNLAYNAGVSDRRKARRRLPALS